MRGLELEKKCIISKSTLPMPTSALSIMLIKLGVDIPRWIRLRLQAFGDDTASIRSFGLDVVTDLCDQLRNGGMPGLPFYSMNQAVKVTEICKRLDLSA